MARLTGALFSLAASGTIADTLTFAKWKGIQYVRTRVIPANPKATGQRRVRGVFISLNELWKRMPTLGREPFTAAAAGQAFTARNKHIGENVVPLRDDANFTNYVWSVPGGGAIPPTGFATGGAATRINVTVLRVPAAPVGYTFLRRTAAAIEMGDPSIDGGIVRTMYTESSIGLAGFFIPTVPSGSYRTGGWIVWTRDSDGKLFYSSFLTSAAVVP